MHALVVEDQSELLTAFAGALRERGHEVTACPDAETAWEAWQVRSYPLVLLDLHLPGENGLDFCRRLRAHELGASSVIILCTATLDPEELEEIGTLADDYVAKPIRWDQFHLRMVFAERRAASVVERWRDLTALKNTDTRFTSFMEHSPATAWLKDEHGRIVYANAAFERVHRINRADLIGKVDAELWPEHASEYKLNDSNVLASGNAIETVESTHEPDGSRRHWLVNKFPIQDAGGQLFVGGMAVEITDRHRIESELAKERELLQTIMDYVPEFLYVKDRESRFVRMNQATATALGLEHPDEGIGKCDHDFFPAELADQYRRDEQAAMERGEPVLNRLEAQNAEQTLWSLTSTAPIKNEAGDVTGLVGVARDVTEHRRMEAAVRRSDERQRALIAAIPDLIFRFDRNGTHLDVKPDQRGSLDRPAHELIGQPLSELLPPEPEGRVLQAIHRALDTGDLQVIEVEADVFGEWRRFEARFVPCGEDEVLVIARDVTEQRVMEERLAFQATHDPLTGLPNRILLNDRIEQALALAKRQGRRVALLFIDLDDFKAINDEHGHAVGDRLLMEVGLRLAGLVREADTVSRLGGDEFAVLIPDVIEPEDPVRVAERINERLLSPILLDGHEIVSRASVGIALSGSGRIDAAELLRQADVAMYNAKRSGKGRFALFGRGRKVA